jgi:hypothetical protein
MFPLSGDGHEKLSAPRLSDRIASSGNHLQAGAIAGSRYLDKVRGRDYSLSRNFAAVKAAIQVLGKRRGGWLKLFFFEPAKMTPEGPMVCKARGTFGLFFFSIQESWDG